MNDGFRDELLGHNHSSRPIEFEPTPEFMPAPIKFNWVALIVMFISIGVTLLVGMLIPGILDEYIVLIVINLIYGFAQAHGFKIKSHTKK